MGRKCIDLTGQKFGRWTVIERAGNRGKGKQACWLCGCECGNTKIVSGYNLRSGRTKSCGCLQIEKTKEQWQDEDFRQMKSEKMKQLNEEQWQDEDFRQIHKDVKHNYKGGITPISMYLRRTNSQWFDLCKAQANYTCQLTGKYGCKLNTHHLKAFSMIVIEAHNLHNIQIKDQVKDYTQEELELLEEYVGSWHKDNSNAVVLSDDAHNLFHKLYGKGNNTPEQYMEFKERYLAGEFKEVL